MRTTRRAAGPDRPRPGASATAAPPATDPPAIETEGLSKVYPSGVRAVSDLNLRVPPGQVFGFLGPNGAGKTTTIKMLLGLIMPTSGRMRLAGWDVRTQRAVAVRQVGAVLEGSRNVYWQFSAWQNLLYFGRLKGLRAATVRPRAEYLLRELGLWDRRHETVGSFSRGMQQKVAVAAALVADPPILLLDEPTIGLDVEAARTVKDWIARLAREQGKTVVLTTHQLDVVEELADRVAVIREGRLVADLAVGELLDRFRHRDRYEIKVDGGGEVHGLPEGFSVTRQDGAATIAGTVDDPLVLYQVLERLRAQRLPLRAVVQPEPTLEQVFLELVHGSDGD